MAQRLGTVRMDSSEVQGPDSYVVVRRISYGQRQKAAQMIALANHGVVPTSATALPDGGISADYLSANDKFTRELLAENILEWNWVDFDGQPLPLPKVDLSVVESLTDEEVTFLARVINAGKPETETKN